MATIVSFSMLNYTFIIKYLNIKYLVLIICYYIDKDINQKTNSLKQ